MEILIGIISGLVTSLGMGGGTVLILLLTMQLNISQHIAQAANLIFFIPTAITTIILNTKNKNIDFKVGVNILAFGIIGAIMGAIASNKLDVKNLRKFFGFFLLFIAIHEIYNFYNLYIKEKSTNNKIKCKKEVDKNEIG